MLRESAERSHGSWPRRSAISLRSLWTLENRSKSQTPSEIVAYGSPVRILVYVGVWGATEQLWNAFHNCSVAPQTVRSTKRRLPCLGPGSRTAKCSAIKRFSVQSNKRVGARQCCMVTSTSKSDAVDSTTSQFIALKWRTRGTSILQFIRHFSSFRRKLVRAFRLFNLFQGRPQFPTRGDIDFQSQQQLPVPEARS